MPTTDVTNSLIASITSQEQSTGNVPINRSTGSPSFNSNTGIFQSYVALNAGANVIGTTVSPITQVYVRNLDTAKSIIVAWTPNGGSLANVVTLNPGDQIILFAVPGGATNPGITELSLTPSAAGALCEFFIGG